MPHKNGCTSPVRQDPAVEGVHGTISFPQTTILEHLLGREASGSLIVLLVLLLLTNPSFIQ